MVEESEQKSNEDTWPSVEVAQAFVLPSYQWMLTRVESADSRIQALVTFVATVTFAVPAVGKAVKPEISLGSPWFLSGLLLALAVIGVGSVARASGSLTLVNPSVIYDKWLHLSKWEFQKDVLCYAGKHFASNTELINRKAKVLTGMTFFFAVELALLALWISTA